MSDSDSLPASEDDLSELLGPVLASAFVKKGYSSLTPVQLSVLDPALAGRDLRISSQTGSGKTLAIGLALRDAVLEQAPEGGKDARPHALVIVPTRELASQVQEELAWLYEPAKRRIAAVTGGSSYRDEHRALARNPSVVVGTPGRLLDHLKHGVIDMSAIACVVLDEADRMLDLGFKEELEAILELAPPGHRTHLVSATFARDVMALADRVQEDALRVEGTPLGSANADIDHVIYLVLPRERVDALVNVLLEHPEDQTLVFAKTRADVADITRELQRSGFEAGALSGEMEQAARVRALAAFKRGELRALVATDVAARGIDVQDIARVVQIDAPTNADSYTHRSGRTGRAGRKGVSAILVPPSALARTVSVLQYARVRFRIERLPTAAAIRATQDQRWLEELRQENAEEVPARIREQVQRIVEAGLTERALASLLSSVHKSQGEPREVTPVAPNERSKKARDAKPGVGRGVHDRGPGPVGERGAQQWQSFRVSWGAEHGADARRLVAMLCRRGGIRGSDIGAIRVNATWSNVDVSSAVAADFARAAQAPDPRDPRVVITPARFERAGNAGPPGRSPAAAPKLEDARHAKARPHGKPLREHPGGKPRFAKAMREHKPEPGGQQPPKRFAKRAK